MTLREKVLLLSGKNDWSTVDIPRLDVPAVVMTDGPHAVCAWSKYKDGGRPKSTAFPTGSALAATWDPALIRRVGQALGEETRAHGFNVLLGPCVNIVRAPLAGRNFETYSEDPHLAGRLGVAYVLGVQSRGVGTSLKHYACNNQEVHRMNGSSVLDERTLREIYLPAFEAIVKEAQPWTVMCAYNRINGVYASEHRKLLTDILRGEWGFGGIVVSDWGANHTIVESVKGGLDLEMPGPAKYYGRLLQEAVQNWQIEESAVDEAVRRMLRFAFRAQAAKARSRGPARLNTPAHQALARQVAERALTLLKNDGDVLPFARARLRSLAVIGPAATDLQTTGGGSSAAAAPYRVQPLEALTRLLGPRVAVRHDRGCDHANSIAPMSPSYCTDKRGFLVEFFNNRRLAGKPAVTRHDSWGLHMNCRNRSPVEGVNEGDFSVRWTAKLRVPETTRYLLRLKTLGAGKVWVDGRLILSRDGQEREVALQKSRPADLKVEFVATPGSEEAKLIVECGPSPEYRYRERIAAAAELARQSDAAVVFVGTPVKFESEGHDRPHLDLPGHQNELVEAVLRANPRTAVVVNAGAPVALPWADRAPAILWVYFPGMEGGNAIARVLLGQMNPSGKLPVSLPRRLEDTPSFGNYPGGREVRYGEGVFVGYRGYDAKGVTPLFPFGHGLSYTRFEYGAVSAPAAIQPDREFKVTVPVRNAGSRAGVEVVQLYVADRESSVARPPKELKAFAAVRLNPGQTRRVAFTLGPRSLSFYDSSRREWVAEPGEFDLLVGSSSRDIRSRATVRLVE
jgi:beta-glucosidase